jgi:predicted RNA-binding Zn-ribbon protein involved in translation (DUF1610 family)
MNTFNKITNGFVVQTFTTVGGKHICVNQEFIAGDPVEYEDADGNPISIDTTKEQYQPFEMKMPKAIGTNGLKFVCPTCFYNKVECVHDGIHSCTIENISPDGDFDYSDISSDANIDRYQCLNCGYVIGVTDNEELIEWIQKRTK